VRRGFLFDLRWDFEAGFRTALRPPRLVVDFRFRVALLRLADTIFSHSEPVLKGES